MKSNKEVKTCFALKNLSSYSSKKHETKSVEKKVNEFLSFAKMRGNFSGHAVKAKQGSKHTKVIAVTNFNDSGVLLNVKPKGNGSRCEVWLTLPGNFAGKSNELFKKLRKKAQEYNN